METHLVFTHHQWFSKIRTFDCRIIDVGFREGSGGGLFTVLPISPLEYRKENPTKASVQVVKQPDGFVNFIITDDWGKEHTIRIHESLKAEIDSAIKSARDQDLLSHEIIF